VAIRTPGFGDARQELLRDIAVLTGGRIVGEETGTRLEDVRPEDLGFASRTVTTWDETTIIDGAGDPEEIAGRMAQLQRQIEETTFDLDRDKLRARRAKLAGGVAVIRAGAASQVELKEKKARVEDALAAARAALEEGIVPGGGVVFLNAVTALDQVQAKGDAAIGVNLLRRALEEPARQIAKNSGQDGSVVVASIRARQAAAGNSNIGLNAMSETYEDLVAAGIVDPTKVARTALANAASVAQMVLTTEVLVAEKPQPVQ
jgi:chaperonin GroEL